MNYQKSKKNLFLKYYRKTDGHITKSAQACNIDRTTYYSWLRLDPKFVETIENIDKEFGDIAHESLVLLAKGAHVTTKITKEVLSKSGEIVTLTELIEENQAPNYHAVSKLLTKYRAFDKTDDDVTDGAITIVVKRASE